MYKEEYQLNKFNHNSNGDPHPQYNNFKKYISSSNLDSNTRYVKIFEGNFYVDPSKQKEDVREFNRILYSAYIYNMISDEIQCVTDFSFLFAIKYDSSIYYELSNFNILGKEAEREIILYYKTNTDKITNVKVFAKVKNNNEHICIQPKIYDPIVNNKTPFHLKASAKGVNTMQKLDDLYKDFSNSKLLNQTELDSQVKDYTVVKSIQNSCAYLNIYGNRNNLNLRGDNPAINFTNKDGSKDYGQFYYSADDKCFALDTFKQDIRTNANIVPLTNKQSLGATWSPFQDVYLISTLSFYGVGALPPAKKGCIAFSNTTNKFYKCEDGKNWVEL